MKDLHNETLNKLTQYISGLNNKEKIVLRHVIQDKPHSDTEKLKALYPNQYNMIQKLKGNTQ